MQVNTLFSYGVTAVQMLQSAQWEYTMWLKIEVALGVISGYLAGAVWISRFPSTDL